jgi:hypothetical protein
MPMDPLLDNASFDPAAITALRNAYEGVCAALQLADRTDPLTEVVAKKVIEHARRGERDPMRLREVVLKEVQSRGDTELIKE